SVQPIDHFSQGGVQGSGGRVAGLAGQHPQRVLSLLRPVDPVLANPALLQVALEAFLVIRLERGGQEHRKALELGTGRRRGHRGHSLIPLFMAPAATAPAPSAGQARGGGRGTLPSRTAPTRRPPACWVGPPWRSARTPARWRR